MATMTVAVMKLGLLGVALVPLERVRRFALTTLQFALHGGAFAALLACGGFALRPELVPNNLKNYSAGWHAELRELVPHLAPGAEWIALGLVLTVVAIPLLELVSFARQIVGYRSAFHRWIRELGRMGNDLREMAADPQATPQQKDRVRDAVAGRSLSIPRPPSGRGRIGNTPAFTAQRLRDVVFDLPSNLFLPSTARVRRQRKLGIGLDRFAGQRFSGTRGESRLAVHTTPPISGIRVTSPSSAAIRRGRPQLVYMWSLKVV